MLFWAAATLRPFFSKGSHERTSNLKGIQNAKSGVNHRQDLHYYQFVRQRHHSSCGAFRQRGGRRPAGSRDDPQQRAVRILRGPRNGMGPPQPHRERQKPTGFISEIHNLVPACGKCNQSKGGSNWREWITGPAPLSPASRGVPNLEEKISRIAKYEERFQPVKLDFEAIVGKGSWEEYWKAHTHLVEEMRRCDEIVSRIRKTIADSFESAELRKA